MNPEQLLKRAAKEAKFGVEKVVIDKTKPIHQPMDIRKCPKLGHPHWDMRFGSMCPMCRQDPDPVTIPVPPMPPVEKFGHTCVVLGLCSGNCWGGGDPKRV